MARFLSGSSGELDESVVPRFVRQFSVTTSAAWPCRAAGLPSISGHPAESFPRRDVQSRGSRVISGEMVQDERGKDSREQEVLRNGLLGEARRNSLFRAFDVTTSLSRPSGGETKRGKAWVLDEY